MSTVATLLDEVESRLNDASNLVWSEVELKSFIRYAIKGLFPTYFTYKLEETIAGPGPQQTMPVGCRNLYMVGQKRASSTRVRTVRGWIEGDGTAFISKSGITGDTLVWSWLDGFDAPDDDDEELLIPAHAEEVVVLSAQKAALEKVLADRVTQERYLSLNVRQAASEQEVLDTIDQLRQSIADIQAKALPRPDARV